MLIAIGTHLEKNENRSHFTRSREPAQKQRHRKESPSGQGRSACAKKRPAFLPALNAGRGQFS
jgi:hypothetical protein